MNKEKQIEEMAKVIDCSLPLLDCEAWRCDGCKYEKYKHMCMGIKQAEVLYNKGYRKASDVAREIFAEIEAIKCVGLLPNSWVKQFAELKKKYESEDEE